MIRYQSVVLLCSDIAISKQFYQDLFQLEIELDIGGLVTFVGGISLWEKKDALYLLYPGSDTITNPEKPAQELYFETDEIVGFSTILQERKVPLLHEIQVTPWNQRTIRCFDPDGNLIEVGESMEHVVKNLGKEGLPPEKIAEKTWMPLEYIKMILQ